MITVFSVFLCDYEYLFVGIHSYRYNNYGEDCCNQLHEDKDIEKTDESKVMKESNVMASSGSVR